MKWQNLLYALFAAAFIAAGTGWFLQNFELQQVPEYTGYKGEARTNNLFAARLFLKRMGIPAERRDGLVNLPDTDTVIVLNTERYSLSEAKTTELLAWVADGGHLITRARTDLENRDQAEEADDGQFGTEDRDELQARLNITIGPHLMPDEEASQILVKPANSTETLTIELDFFNSLNTNNDDAEHYQLENDTWFLDQPYGEGHVSLLATLDFFENHSLANSDHGKFFWYLIHSHNTEPKAVWLVHQDTLPSLITLLFRHAAPLLFALSLLLIFTFWALMPRFGAMIPEPPPQRRRILDHIKASGQFLWKRQNKGREALCHTMQQSIIRQAQQRIPGWQFLPQNQQYAALADYLQRPGLTDVDSDNDQPTGTTRRSQASQSSQSQPADLQRLLTATITDEQGFTNLVQLAQRIRNST